MQSYPNMHIGYCKVTVCCGGAHIGDLQHVHGLGAKEFSHARKGRVWAE